jgi:hypothetical protein
MNREFEAMDVRLEQAMTEIRNDDVDPAVVRAAADRVWARLAAADRESGRSAAAEHEPIRGCADFQALIPDFKAGKLPEAKTTLVRDHLHECVACRRVYEGRVVTMPAPAMEARRSAPVYRWAAAAVVILGVGGAVWFGYEQYGGGSGRAMVQAVNGTLYRVGDDGNLTAITVGSELPDGVEVRTAKDSDAMVQLRDGSTLELRERSGFSTMATASDLTVRLARGSIIVQAAKRRKGHLYVATADCRVAVTGTVFSVVSGVKGSRVSVVEGEVHVERENQDHVLRPGDQMVTSPTIEPTTVKADVEWSRNKDKLIQQIDKLATRIQQIHLPAVRYSSNLLDRLPANTAMFASIPNLGEYLGEAQGVFTDTMAQSPELRQLWSKQGVEVQQVIEKMRAASEYLGDEVVIAGFANEGGGMVGPAAVAETKKDGFPQFLKAQMPQAAVETRPGLVVFGHPDAVKVLAAALDGNGGFNGTPFHARIAEAYKGGAGMLFAADLSRMKDSPARDQNLSFFLGEQKEVNKQMEMRATLGFSGERTGVAAWLSAPAPMGSFDYISPEATFVGAFVVKDPKTIIDQLVPLGEKVLGPAHETPPDSAQLQADLVSSLGGEFSVAFDGPIFPPSWKLITEVYDPAKTQAALQKVAEFYHLRTGQETFEGRTYYMIAAQTPNALTEAHYTFADGYLIAGPTRQLISKALQIKTAGTSIARSAKFLELEPRDHYANYSAVVYENLGQTLAPLAGIIGSMIPQAPKGGRGPDLSMLGNMKPMLVAAYAEGDKITVAAGGNMLAKGMAGLLQGNVAGIFGGPMMQMQRQRVGAR